MRLFHRWLVVPALLLVTAPFSFGQTPTDPTGHWQGKIHIPNRELNVTIDLAKNTKGSWTGSMSVPTSTTIDVPLENITVDGTLVRFAASLPAKTIFEGHLSTDATKISGNVSNAQGGVPFELERQGEANVKVPTPSSVLTKPFEGVWEGTLEVGGRSLRVRLTLAAGDDGTAVGTLVNLDRGTEEIPITTVTVQDMQLQLDVRVISGTYRGTLANDQIVGEWSQGPNKLPLTFKRPSPD